MREETQNLPILTPGQFVAGRLQFGTLVSSDNRLGLVFKVHLECLTIARADSFRLGALDASRLGLVALETPGSAGLTRRTWAARIDHGEIWGCSIR